mmetsp:Transcript_95354/g.297227  ORF Transcript_95354/g.297227 Transcript_95354/m.297227 type:complete len:255 (-) Transcript_95354:271-1035(-)
MGFKLSLMTFVFTADRFFLGIVQTQYGSEPPWLMTSAPSPASAFGRPVAPTIVTVSCISAWASREAIHSCTYSSTTSVPRLGTAWRLNSSEEPRARRSLHFMRTRKARSRTVSKCLCARSSQASSRGPSALSSCSGTSSAPRKSATPSSAPAVQPMAGTSVSASAWAAATAISPSVFAARRLLLPLSSPFTAKGVAKQPTKGTKSRGRKSSSLTLAVRCRSFLLFSYCLASNSTVSRTSFVASPWRPASAARCL